MRCSLLILSSYLDDELDAARRAEVDAHIIGCERCHKGLDYLREEVSHIGGLARVHLSDPAAHTFLEQLGLIGPDDHLPPRPPRPPSPPSGAPPWFTGGPARGALPWTARRSEPGPSDQPSLPFRDQAVLEPRGSPGWEALAAGDGMGGAGEFEVHLSGRAASGMGAEEEREAARSSEAMDATRAPDPRRPADLLPAADAREPTDAPGPAGAGDPADAPEILGASEWSEPLAAPEARRWTPPEAAGAASRAERTVPVPGLAGLRDDAGAPPSPWSQPGAGAMPFTPPRPLDQAPQPAAPGGDPWGWAPRDRPLPGAAPSATAPPSALPRGYPAGAIPDQPRASPSWAAPHSGSDPSPAPGTTGAPLPASSPAARPAGAPRVDGVLRPAAPAVGGGGLAPSRDGGGRPAAPPGSPRGPAGPDGDVRPPFSPLGSATAPTLTSELAPWPPAGSERELAPLPVHPPTPSVKPDGTPDPLIDPLLARAARPPRRLHPSLPGRLRDELALRVALARGTRRRAAGGGDEILPDSFLGGGSAPGSAADAPEADGPVPAGRAEPASELHTSAAPGWPPLGGPAPARPVPPMSERDGGRRPTTAEELPGPPPHAAAPFRAAPLIQDAGWTSRRQEGRHSRALQGRALGSSLPPWLARARPRWLAVAAGAALLLVVVLLIALPGGSAPVARHRAATSTHAAVSHPSVAPSAGAGAAAPAVSPAAAATASASPTPASTPAAAPAGPSQSYGGAGTGWQLASVRCCYVQGSGFTRVVFDMSGSGAAPRMTLSFPSPTSLVVSFAGANAAGSFPPVSGGVITSMTPPTGSAAVFQFALSRAVSVKDWNFLPNGDSLSPTPLIYFDLG